MSKANETPLSRLYVEYLVEREKPARRKALADALNLAGFRREAACLRALDAPRGPALPAQTGDLHIGEMPPALPAGASVTAQWWFDTCEVSLMRCVPFEESDPEVPLAWMATRSVMAWQVRAFSALAPIDGMDKRPVPAGDGPAVGMTRGFAGLYCAWFGKSLCDRSIWEAASWALGAQASGLWGPTPREWAGVSDIDDAFDEVVAPELLALDPLDEYDDDDAPPRMLLPAGHAAADLGFRSAVRLQMGVLQTPPSPKVGPPGVRLCDRLARW